MIRYQLTCAVLVSSKTHDLWLCTTSCLCFWHPAAACDRALASRASVGAPRCYRRGQGSLGFRPTFRRSFPELPHHAHPSLYSQKLSSKRPLAFAFSSGFLTQHQSRFKSHGLSSSPLSSMAIHMPRSRTSQLSIRVRPLRSHFGQSFQTTRMSKVELGAVSAQCDRTNQPWPDLPSWIVDETPHS